VKQVEKDRGKHGAQRLAGETGRAQHAARGAGPLTAMRQPMSRSAAPGATTARATRPADMVTRPAAQSSAAETLSDSQPAIGARIARATGHGVSNRPVAT
jgi:hypothetical protein